MPICDICRCSFVKPGKTRNPLYQVWYGVKRRCYDKKHKSYSRYGGRGIEVCREWIKDKNAFFEWCLNNGYKIGLQLDRVDNDGHYHPDNCRFVTNKVNQSNRGNNTTIDYNGKKYTLSQIAEEKGLFNKTLWDRIYKHRWPIIKAIETPVKPRKNSYKKKCDG